MADLDSNTDEITKQEEESVEEIGAAEETVEDNESNDPDNENNEEKQDEDDVDKIFVRL